MSNKIKYILYGKKEGERIKGFKIMINVEQYSDPHSEMRAFK